MRLHPLQSQASMTLGLLTRPDLVVSIGLVSIVGDLMSLDGV